MPRLSLIKRAVCPPDGFRYLFPEDGYIVHAWDWDTWTQNARNHAQANNMETPIDLVQTMEEQLCLLLPPGWCNYDDEARPRPAIAMTWDDIKAGLTTFTQWVAQGAKFVPQTEADRRALVCSRCYLNLPVAGCAACHAAVEKITQNKHTQHDNYLRACGVCKCLLKALVHFPVEVMAKSALHQELYPSFCWKKIGGENYRG